MIQSITIVSQQGVKVYSIGDRVNNSILNKIEIETIAHQGDPFDHYIGRTEDGKLLFEVNCLIPCVVEYSH